MTANPRLTGARPNEIARLGVGIKTQVPNVFNGLPVHENVFIAAARMGSAAKARGITADVMDRPGLAKALDAHRFRLSEGFGAWRVILSRR